MNRYLKLFIFCAVTLTLVNAGSIQAQERMHTRMFLNRTNLIIRDAKETVAVGKVYTGDLVKAVHHQRFARTLFREGKFERAVLHSMRARELSFAAIKANKHEIRKDWELKREEKALIKNRPENSELDGEVKIPEGADDKSVLNEKEEDLKD
jgi:hypothetical protein